MRRGRYCSYGRWRRPHGSARDARPGYPRRSRPARQHRRWAPARSRRRPLPRSYRSFPHAWQAIAWPNQGIGGASPIDVGIATLGSDLTDGRRLRRPTVALPTTEGTGLPSRVRRISVTDLAVSPTESIASPSKPASATIRRSALRSLDEANASRRKRMSLTPAPAVFDEPI